MASSSSLVPKGTSQSTKDSAVATTGGIAQSSRRGSTSNGADANDKSKLTILATKDTPIHGFVEALLSTARVLNLDADEHSHLLWVAGVAVEMEFEAKERSRRADSEMTSEQLHALRQAGLARCRELLATAKRVEDKITACDPTLLDKNLQQKLEREKKKNAHWEGRCTALAMENQLMHEKLQEMQSRLDSTKGGADGGAGAVTRRPAVGLHPNRGHATESESGESIKAGLAPLIASAELQPRKVLVAALLYAQEHAVKQGMEIAELKGLMAPLAEKLKEAQQRH
jgi:hypothetical protein